MALSIESWLDQYSSVHVRWLLKRLSANDTQLTGGHQAGFYIPRDVLFRVLPDLDRQELLNPKVTLDLHLDSHGSRLRPVATWYNNKFHGGTRNETRITSLGGSASPLLNVRNTGSLIVVAFIPSGSPICEVHLWVCRNADEEWCVEDRWGPVEPGQIVSFGAGQLFPAISGARRSHLRVGEIPPSWLEEFPSPQALFDRTLELASRRAGDVVDSRLIGRRELEYNLFAKVEEAVELPLLMDLVRNRGSMEQFLNKAKSIVNRRKSRSGLSLEWHMKHILNEEGLSEGRDFEYQPTVDYNARPDFIFPSMAAYMDESYPTDSLRMLAVKTTCKDRWRQILKEADRIPNKHLLTFQEGVSNHQFQEMKEAGVRLVVPRPLHGYYSKFSRELLSLEDFIKDVQSLSGFERC